MNLCVETDMGGDFDDWFALCYLIAAGVDIRCVTLCPGHADQVALASLLRKRCGLDFTIGVAKPDIAKRGASGVYNQVLDYCGMSRSADADGAGERVIGDAFAAYPDMEFFVIGPPKNIGSFFATRHHLAFSRLTMQGGFLGYDCHDIPCKRLEKFEGRTHNPSFNPNGDRRGTEHILEAAIGERRFVGKNVCHGVEFNTGRELGEITSEAANLFHIGAKLYFEKHESKKFHDPLAAVLHLHPEIGKWVRGYIEHTKDGWGTIPIDEGSTQVLAAVDEERFWEHIRLWT